MNNELEQGLDRTVYEEMSKAMYEEKDRSGCSAVGYQDVNVCIPVTIKPFGEAGNAKTQCLGKAVVTFGCDKCKGKPDEECKFTISQKLRVEVPVTFGARAEVGKASVECEGADGNCESCE